MRTRLVGLLSAAAVAAAVAGAGCSDYDNDEEGGTGGAGATTTTGGGGATAPTGGAGATPATGGAGATAPTGGAGATPVTGGGGAGATGGSSPVTTLPGATVLSALTDEQSSQLCADIWAYYAEAISTEVICKFRALVDGLSLSAHDDEQLKQGCTSAETRCLADPTTAWPSDLSLLCGSIPADCGATVAEYSTCIQDIAANFNAQVPTMPTCTEITLSLNQEIWDFVQADRLPSCTATCSIWPPDPRDLR